MLSTNLQNLAITYGTIPYGGGSISFNEKAAVIFIAYTNDYPNQAGIILVYGNNCLYIVSPLNTEVSASGGVCQITNNNNGLTIRYMVFAIN